MYLGQLCLLKGVLYILIHKSYVTSIKRYFLSVSMLRFQYSLKFSFSNTLLLLLLLFKNAQWTKLALDRK